jgi:hypothetical protein
MGKYSSCQYENCGEVLAVNSYKYCVNHQDRKSRPLSVRRVCKFEKCTNENPPGEHRWFCEDHSTQASREILRDNHTVTGDCLPGCGCALYTSWHQSDCECKTCLMKRGVIPVDYWHMHEVVRKLRGRAAMYRCATGCGRSAYHWATIHGCDGTDIIRHYMPLCVKCHLGEYDDVGAANRGRRHTEEEREHGRAAQLARPEEMRTESALRAWETRRENGNDHMTAEQRERMSAVRRGKKRPPGYGEKMRVINKGKKRTPEQKATIKAAQQRRREEGNGPFRGPDGKFMSRSVYEAETGTPCEI